MGNPNARRTARTARLEPSARTGRLCQRPKADPTNRPTPTENAVVGNGTTEPTLNGTNRTEPPRAMLNRATRTTTVAQPNWREPRTAETETPGAIREYVATLTRARARMCARVDDAVSKTQRAEEDRVAPTRVER